MYINVLPINISFSEEVLTYYIKNELSKYLNIGSIVTIPIRNNITYWIVVWFSKESKMEFEIKSVIDIVCSFPILSPYQINLIFSISNKYFYSINKIINLFLPNFIYNRLDKNAFQDILEIDIKNQINKSKNKPVFIHNIWNKKYEEIINKEFWDISDIVFIFWDDFSIDSFLEKNLEYKDMAIIYKNSMTYSKKYKVFLEILSKKKNIIIWTRKILQYNLSAYKKIVYIEDSLVKYNYNQLEKYKNLDIINFLYLQNIFELYFISNIPSLELFYLSKKEKFEYKTY